MAQHGVIYIINNRLREGEERFKVGKTYDLERRLSELNGETSNFGEFKKVALFPVLDMVKAESEVHIALHKFRIISNREFFEGKQDEIINIVKNISSKYIPKEFISNIKLKPKKVGQEHTEKYKSYLLLAEQGHIKEQFELGEMYQEGLGVSENYKEAIKWYRLSSKQQFAPAQYRLGFMYDQGLGVPQDYNEAVKWYRLSAGQGYSNAQYSMGVFCEYGLGGVPQDKKEAVKWYQRSEERNYAPAQSKLEKIKKNDFKPTKKQLEKDTTLERMDVKNGHIENFYGVQRQTNQVQGYMN